MCLLKISLCCHLFPLRPNKAPRSHHLQPLLLSGTWLFCLLSVCEMVWAHLGKPKYFYHKCRCLNSSKGLSTFQHICKKKKEKKKGVGWQEGSSITTTFLLYLLPSPYSHSGPGSNLSNSSHLLLQSMWVLSGTMVCLDTCYLSCPIPGGCIFFSCSVLFLQYSKISWTYPTPAVSTDTGVVASNVDSGK